MVDHKQRHFLCYVVPSCVLRVPVWKQHCPLESNCIDGSLHFSYSCNEIQLHLWILHKENSCLTSWVMRNLKKGFERILTLLRSLEVLIKNIFTLKYGLLINELWKYKRHWFLAWWKIYCCEWSLLRKSTSNLFENVFRPKLKKSFSYLFLKMDFDDLSV